MGVKGRMRILEAGRNDRGFTLIELMVVVVLIGILSATIIPQMQGTYEEALLRSTSRRLLGALSLARSQSVAVGRPHRVRLESDGYYVERSAIKTGSGPDFEPLPNVRGAVGKLDPRISIEVEKSPGSDTGPSGSGRSYAVRKKVAPETGPNEILFFADGTTQGGGLRLRDRQGFGLAIRINPITGGLRVARLERQMSEERER